MRRELVEQVARGEPIGDDDVRTGQQPPPAHRDEFGVAGAATDEGDAGADGFGVHPVHRHDPRLQRLDQRRAHGGGPPWAATGEHADGQPVVLAHRRGDRGAARGVVGADTEHARPLGRGGDGGVDLRVVGGREGVPGAVEVAVAVGARGPAQLPGGGHALDRGGHVGSDDLDVRTRGQQRREAALGDGAAADDHHPATGEREPDQVRPLTAGHAAAPAGRDEVLDETGPAWTGDTLARTGSSSSDVAHPRGRWAVARGALPGGRSRGSAVPDRSRVARPNGVEHNRTRAARGPSARSLTSPAG